MRVRPAVHRSNLAADVVVVGGGIGGLSSALALARLGFEVQVLERSPRFAEIGAGLQLAPNATRALRALGVLDEVMDSGVVPRQVVGRNAVTGAVLTYLDLDDVADRYGAPYIVVHRCDLLDALLHACQTEPRIALSPDRLVDFVDDADDDHVVARCTDGWSYPCHIVVGADGLHSTVRHTIHPDQPVNSGFVAYRGAVPTERVPGAPGYRDVVVWIGPGLHFVQYPLRRDGSLFNQVAVFRSDDLIAGRSDWGGPDELARRFACTTDEVRVALEALDKQHRWEMLDREPLERWHRKRTVLLGDAAHPMLQYLAQGCCQAIEDSVALADAIDTQVDSTWSFSSVAKAFTTYERTRLPQASRVQRTARIWGDIWHVDGLAMALRDEAFQLRHPRDYRRIDWLFGPPVAQASGITSLQTGARVHEASSHRAI